MSKKRSKAKKRRKARKAIRAEMTHSSTVHNAKADGLKTKNEKNSLQLDE